MQRHLKFSAVLGTTSALSCAGRKAGGSGCSIQRAAVITHGHLNATQALISGVDVEEDHGVGHVCSRVQLGEITGVRGDLAPAASLFTPKF